MNPQDKPITMPLRDFLIKNIALSKGIPSSVIEAIISHQFDSANAATYVHKSLEISGFGRFVFSDKKAQYQMDRYGVMEECLKAQLQTPGLSDKEIALINEKLEGNKKNANELRRRL